MNISAYMQPLHIQGRHVGAHLEANRETRPIRANREKALLSHVFTWAIRHPIWGCVIQHNPCKGVVRNKETKRIRIVDDAEYMAVFNLANHNVQRLMTLVYRTLQRPSDLLIVEPANIARRIVDGLTVEVLRIKQSKTGATVEIILSADLKHALFGSHTIECSNGSDSNYKENKYFIINSKGKPYTLDGFNSNFARALNKYREIVKINTGVKPQPFGIYDLKGKGATDMYQNGIALEYIQALAAHASVTTTEIYIKAHINKPVLSNTRIIGS